MRGARPWVILPDYLLGGLVPAPRITPGRKAPICWHRQHPSDPRVTPADHFGPSFAVAQVVVVIIVVQEVHEPTAPPVANWQIATRIGFSDVTPMA